MSKLNDNQIYSIIHTKYQHELSSAGDVHSSFVSSWDIGNSHLSILLVVSEGVSFIKGSILMQVSVLSGNEQGVTTSWGECGGDNRASGGALHARCSFSTDNCVTSIGFLLNSSSFTLYVFSSALFMLLILATGVGCTVSSLRRCCLARGRRRVLSLTRRVIPVHAPVPCRSSAKDDWDPHSDSAALALKHSTWKWHQYV